MASTVFLHIGMMKSGTTYLQELCELNAAALMGAGMLWPTANRYQAVRDLFASPPDGLPSEWRVLAKEFRRHDGTALLSNELIAPLSGERIRRLLDGLSADDRYVVITARDLGRGVPSHWQTSLRNGKTLPWSAFAAAVCGDPVDDSALTHQRFWQHHDVAATIRRWQSAVPVERMTVVTVPPKGSDPSILADRFGSVIGIDLAGLVQPLEVGNASMGAHSAELMRRVNLRLGPDGVVGIDHGLKIALGRRVLAARAFAEPRFALSAEQQAWVARRGERMIEEIQSTGVEIRGSLDDLVPQPASWPDSIDPAVSPEAELLEAAEDGLIGMAAVVSEMHQLALDAAAQLRQAQAERERLARRLKKARKRRKRARRG